MAIDRSIFKPSDPSAMQSQNQQVASLKPNKGRADYHDIEDGENKFRIYPFHPNGTGRTMWEAKCVSWLEVSVEIKDSQGEGTGKFEKKSLPIFNARHHLGATYDPVELYMQFWDKIFKSEGLDYNSVKPFKNKYFFGFPRVAPKVSWVLYADKIVNGVSTFGRLELTNGLKKKIETDIMKVFNDGVMADPFSDPEDGYILIIDKDSNADSANYYKCRIDQRKLDKTRMEFITLPLTEAQLEHFMQQTPLSDQFRGTYKATDCNKQLEGLKNLDAKIAATEGRPALFEDAEFLDGINACIDEIEKLLPKEEPQDVDISQEVNELPWSQEEESGRDRVLEQEKLDAQLNTLRTLK